jgi:hypothetical protein
MPTRPINRTAISMAVTKTKLATRAIIQKPS